MKTCMSFFQLLNVKKIFRWILLTKQLTVAIDFHSMEKTIMQLIATLNFWVNYPFNV